MFYCSGTKEEHSKKRSWGRAISKSAAVKNGEDSNFNLRFDVRVHMLQHALHYNL